MTPAELSHTVLSAVRRAVAAQELQVAVPERVVVRRPPRAGCGDYATNVALQLAGPAGCSAHTVAGILARRLKKEPGIAQVEIAGTGFLNITLSARAYRDVVRQVRIQGSGYGRGDGLAADEPVTVTAGPGQPVRPGEPAGHGPPRGQVVAEVVNRLLAAAGARPATPGAPWELLVVQELPAGSVPAGALMVSGNPSPPDGSPDGHPEGPPADGGRHAAGSAHGDVGLSRSGAYPAAQGALRPGTGPSTEGPQPAGAPSTTGLATAAGPAGAPASEPASAPSAPTPAAPLGLGPDATRWALLRPPAEDTPRLTADLLEQRESNPLFRIRYAHARTRALVRNARELGVEIEGPEGNAAVRADAGPEAAGAPYHHPAETELLGLIADYPRVVESAARRRAPDRVARHLERLADSFFRFHDECPPLPKGDEKPSAAHAARIRLTDATGVVLAGGLHLLGISAPELM